MRLIKYYFIFFLSLFTSMRVAGQEYYLLVGTYDSPKSEGIYLYTFNSNDGSYKAISHVKTSNPSFLAVSPDQKFVYAVNENANNAGNGGGVTSFSMNKKTGGLKWLSGQSSGGNHPCYISVDQTGRWVVAGNYTSGNFSILPVSKKGILGKAFQVVQHKGSGPDTTRQQSPHVHAVFFEKDNKTLLVPDLGIDKIMTYRFDAKTGKVNPTKTGFAALSPGSGPRHLDIHPNGKYIYLTEELTGTVVVFRDHGDGNLENIQDLSTLPLTYRGPAGTADIHVSPDGRFLYVSNRGSSNTIAIFSIDTATGLISLVGHQSVLGEKPRNFNFDPTGKFLLVGNENSDEIVIFKRDIITGLLTESGYRISVGKPVCLKWVDAK